MNVETIIQKAKEIIALTAKYKYYDEDQALELQKTFTGYREGFLGVDNKYAIKLISFLDDVLSDISKRRPLQIDALKEDDELHAYVLAKREYNIFSCLVDTEIYDQIMYHGPGSHNSEKLDALLDIFVSNLKKLSPDIISKHLLIFTLEKQLSPKQYLTRLWMLRRQRGFTTRQNKKLFQAIVLYQQFLRAVKYSATNRLLNGDFTTHYIEVKQKSNTNPPSLDFINKDASKQRYRSGNPNLEYYQLVSSIL